MARAGSRRDKTVSMTTRRGVVTVRTFYARVSVYPRLPCRAASAAATKLPAPHTTDQTIRAFSITGVRRNATVASTTLEHAANAAPSSSSQASIMAACTKARPKPPRRSRAGRRSIPAKKFRASQFPKTNGPANRAPGRTDTSCARGRPHRRSSACPKGREAAGVRGYLAAPKEPTKAPSVVPAMAEKWSPSAKLSTPPISSAFGP